MRVNPNHSSDMMAALERINDNESSVLEQLSSGKRIQKPSDDPSGMAALVNVQSSISRTAQYLSNVSAMNSQLRAADSSLSSVVTVLERALSLGVGGANGTLSDRDRESVAAELDGIHDQLLELANSSSQGVYLFAGTATTTKPFTSSGAGIIYAGSPESNQVAIGDGLSIQTNLPGTSVFGDDATGVFASIESLATAIRSNSDVTSALDSVSKARDRVSTARVTYGNTLNQINSSQLIMNERKLQLSQQETDVAGADIADVATQLSTSITARNALLAAIGKTDGMSLFDYLK